MYLLIDAGNTRIKWALAAQDAQPGMWLQQGMAEHHALQPQHIRVAVATVASGRAVRAVWIANVAGTKVRSHLQVVLQAALPGVALHWFASSAAACGVENGYRDPGQLGCDRFAAAIGARRLFPDQALLVANCGTATTLDAISATGRFVGGMILPGLGTMANSLNRQTAQLPPVQYSQPGVLHLADNTEQAIISGCIAAQIGAITQGLHLMRSQAPQVLCILSGGAAQVLSAALSEPHRVQDHLVLHGLQAVAAQALPEQEAKES